MKKKKFDIIPSILIERAGGEGKSIAHIDGKVAFVKYAAAGDIADLKLTRVKGKYIEAEIQLLITESPVRQQAICEHFGTCGGCQWQHVKYADQLQIKNQWALDCLHRIGKIDIEEICPPMPAPATEGYRNKVEFTFSDKCWEAHFDKENPKGLKGLGFHIPGRWDKVLDIHQCHLAPELLNQIQNRLKEIAMTLQFEFWNTREQTGWLRNLLLRTSSQGDLMVILAVKEHKPEQIQLLFDTLSEEFPQVNSWMYAVNDKRNDSWTGLEPIVYKGKGFMEEQMEDLRFKIRPFSFFQTNYNQALNLYKLAREWAQIADNDIVYDLYTGTGTIALFVAKLAKKVIGLEYVESSIADAKDNANINGLNNTYFQAGDMKDLLNADFFATHGQPDIIITDPPRDGMHPDVIQAILNALPARIVYVSCNPATQARDLALLSEKYTIKKSQAVDMFPHTSHIENVVLLTPKSTVR